MRRLWDAAWLGEPAVEARGRVYTYADILRVMERDVGGAEVLLCRHDPPRHTVEAASWPAEGGYCVWFRREPPHPLVLAHELIHVGGMRLGWPLAIHEEAARLLEGIPIIWLAAEGAPPARPFASVASREYAVHASRYIARRWAEEAGAGAGCLYGALVEMGMIPDARGPGDFEAARDPRRACRLEEELLDDPTADAAWMAIVTQAVAPVYEYNAGADWPIARLAWEALRAWLTG